jgi:NADP-dependent 3-hydroxy acid dehydrogenase YdfG
VNNLVQQVHGLRAMNQRQTERIAALEAELELKQGIIIADDTKIKLLELELANRDRTIAELRQKLTKRDMMLENAAGYLSGSDYDNERAYAKKIIAFLDEAE